VKIIGLTGGIGMGKSFAARVFRRAGVPVFDADATVHRLQAKGGRAIPAIARRFAGVVADGVLDRAALRRIVLADRAALRALEGILHPLVRAAQRRFIARARGRPGRGPCGSGERAGSGAAGAGAGAAAHERSGDRWDDCAANAGCGEAGAGGYRDQDGAVAVPCAAGDQAATGAVAGVRRKASS
jgi:hypothetical protein